MNEKIQVILQEGERAAQEQKTIRDLLQKFQRIEAKIREEDKQMMVEFLFRGEKTSELLESRGMKSTDTPAYIISNLQEALRLPPQEETQAMNDNEQNDTRDQTMHFQEEINELYRLNNEAADEDERLQSALALLEIFNSNKTGDEAVEVIRTKGGEVEVVFAEDIQDSAALTEAARDITDTEKRIAEYEQSLQQAVDEAPAGIFKKLFGSSNSQNVSGNSARVQELEGKILRSQLELAEKMAAVKVRNERLHTRLAEKKKALEEPLLMSGIDQFSGKWRKLLDELRQRISEARQSLTVGVTDREERIHRLEGERDSIENSSQTA